MKLLLAEDTRDLNKAVSTMLTINGYAVDCAFDGEEAEAYLRDNGYDAIVLDIMMPRKSGLEVLSELRAAGDTTPVLMLTAKSEVDDRVTGLDAGADDYLTKPFAMKELLARIRALTRRGVQARAMGNLVCGDLTMTADTLEISAESSIRLSAREFALLQLLARSEAQELAGETLLTQIWGEEEGAGPDTVWLYISYLRTKLFSVGSSLRIEGERGGSYRLLRGVPDRG